MPGIFLRSDAIVVLSLGGIIFGLVYFAYKKMGYIEELKKTNSSLNTKLSELDAQAKIIIKTDLELNRTQEELDKRITTLLALQKFSQRLAGVLDKDTVFANIEESLLEDLEFSSCLAFLKNNGDIEVKSAINIRQDFLKEDFDFKKILDILEEKNIIVGSIESKHLLEITQSIESQLSLTSFIIAPLKINEEIKGALVLGNLSKDLNEGDKEVAEITARQISQTLENITMFEKLYQSQRELEQRIMERTKELTNALNKLERANKLKNEFVSAVSHELRTPLTSIKGYASLLANEKFGSVPQKVKTRLERINLQADALVELINNILDISRIESGRTEINITKNNLSMSLKECLDLLTPQAKEKNINLNLNAPPGLYANFDKSLIERAIVNLVNNAIKFTPEGKNVELILQDFEDKVKILIKDQGIGIAEEDKENIFKEFYRTKQATNNNIKGTGLGLSLVKNIVKAHKGTIEVESQIGQGSVFIITLPKT